MPMTTHPIPPSTTGSPPWVIATLYPNQGDWSEGEYLELSDRTNRLIELSDGIVEVLDMPSTIHQGIVACLHRHVRDHLQPPRLGRTFFAPYPLRLAEGKFREPDVLFVTADHAHWFGVEFATGADCVMEVLSEDRGRDMQMKRAEYERAGIAEYWIVDPREKRITVLRLVNGVYQIAGDYTTGQRAASVVLPGFEIDVDMVFKPE
jgi:Uma2 family endonuclease